MEEADAGHQVHLQCGKSALLSILTAAGIIGVNTAVFVAWRVPALRHVMDRYFIHTPAIGLRHDWHHTKIAGWHSCMLTCAVGRLFAMAGSVFSHQSVPHFVLNMLALYSFAMPVAHHSYPASEFAAFYMASGLRLKLTPPAMRTHAVT